MDDSRIIWTKNERRQLVRLCVLRILVLGDQGIGKTSLLMTLLQDHSYVTGLHDRTIVFEVKSWNLRNGKVVLAFDLGGHDAYYYTSQFLHFNCSQNVIFLCQALGSDKYDVSFQWLQSTLTRSPECMIIPVLTKADEIPLEEISERVCNFTKMLKQFLEKEIDILEKVHNDSKGCEDELSNLHKLETYQTLLIQFDKRLFVISVKKDHPYFENVGKLSKYIEELSKEQKYQIEIPKLYEEFYRELGKMGTVVEVKNIRKPNEEGDDYVTEPRFIQSTMEMRNDETKGDQNIANTHDQENTGEDNFEKVKGKEQEIRFTSDTEVNPLQRYSAPIQTHKSNTRPDLELQRQQSSPTDTGSAKLEQLQREGKILLFTEAVKIFEEISKKYPGSCADVKLCLSQFHSYGLCLWFQGHPHIEKIIFNHFGFFKDLLTSVFHHETLNLPFSELDKDLRRQLFEDVEYRYIDCVHRVINQGLVSKAMLKILLYQRDFHEDVETVMMLFQQLHIAHFHTAGKELFLFIPYFVDRKEIPSDIKKILPKLVVCSKDELALNFQLKGNIPSTFWHHLCVNLMNELHDPSETQLRIVFQNGMWAQVDSLWLLVMLSGNILKVTIRGKTEYVDVHKIWNLTYRICNILRNLIKTSWPGLAASISLDCTDCQLRKEDVKRIHQLLLLKMLETDNDSIYVGCQMDIVKQIPSLFVRPPSKGNFYLSM